MSHFGISRSFVAALIALSIVLVITFSYGVPVHADGITVTNCTNDSAFASAMVNGGLIQFNCGGETHATAKITLSQVYTVTKNTTIDGDNGRVTLAGTHSVRLFVVNNGVQLNFKNIILADAYSSTGNGGTIVNNGFLSLDHTTIQNVGDSGFDGGGIYTTGAVDITYSTFVNNKAGRGGVIAANGAGAQVTVANSSLHDSGVSSNVAGSNRGGAIYLTGGANVQIYSSDIYSNSAGFGGAIYNDNGTLQLNNSTIRNNKSTNSGAGGIDNASNTTLTNDTFTNNSALSQGGAIHNAGTLNVTNSIFSGNKSSLGGGGLYMSAGTANVTGSLFTGNSESAAGYGGGAVDTRGGTLNVFKSTFSGNTAGGGGAALENAFGATTNLTNVTLYGNIGGNSGGAGGGFYNYKSTATLTNVTISNNGATTGGGISNVDPTSQLTLVNVLLNKNNPGGNCQFSQAPTTSTTNLSSDNTCGFGTGRDNIKPKLGNLETNGGNLWGAAQTPMLTQRLNPGSPAIDDGTKTGCPSTDERSVARYYGHSCEVGAYEFVPCPSSPTKASLIAPANNATGVTAKVALDWAGPDCANTWNVVVRKGSKTGSVVFSKTKLTTSQVTTGSLGKGKYFWQVKACVGSKCTAGAWWKFTR